MSIKWKIVMAMLLTAFVVVLGMGIVSINISEKTLESRAIEFMTGIIERNAYEVSQQVVTVQKIVQSSYIDLTSTYNDERAKTDKVYLLNYLNKLTPTIRMAAELNQSSSSYLILFDPEDYQRQIGQIIYADVNRDGIPEKSNTPDWMAGVLERSITQKDNNQTTYYWDVNPNDSVMHCYSLYFKNGKLIALIGADIYKDIIKNKLRSTKYLESGFLYLSDEKEQVIYHLDLVEGSVNKTGLSTVNASMTKTEEAILENNFKRTVNLNNEKIMRGEVTLLNGWHLGMEVKLIDIYKGLDELKTLIFITMLSTLFVATMIGLYLGTKIGAPYIQIAKQLVSIDANEYELQLDSQYITRKDEAGVLTRSLLQMVDRLEKSYKEIQHYNQNLEKLVEERTNDLFKTNEELEEALGMSEEKQAMLSESNNQLELSLETIEKTQQELMKAEKLASLGYLVTGISHQINTPIGNGITTVSFLKREVQQLESKLNEGVLQKNDFLEFLVDLNEGLEGISQNLKKSSQLVDRFKGTAFNHQNDPILPVHLASNFKDWVMLAKNERAGLNCDIALNVPEQLVFNCRPAALKRLLDELLFNAFDHAFDNVQNPCIKIEVKALDELAQGIELSFKDNGNGVISNEIQHLFTPFYTTKMGKNHEGLGLNMVHNFVFGIYKGDIQVKSKEHEGLEYIINMYEEVYSNEEVKS